MRVAARRRVRDRRSSSARRRRSRRALLTVALAVDFGEQRFGVARRCGRRRAFRRSSLRLRGAGTRVAAAPPALRRRSRECAGASRAQRCVLDQQEPSHFALQLRDDVARLLLADAGQRLEEDVIARVDRARDAPHRRRERARRGLGADARDARSALRRTRARPRW